MRIAAITIVHGRHRHLAEQRAGFERSTAALDAHFVVAMGDHEVGRQLRGTDTEIIDMPADVGCLPLARARNLGAAAASGSGAELLVFLDVDCVPSPQMLYRYADAATRTRGGHLLCGPVCYLDPAPSTGYDWHAITTTARPHPARPSPPPTELIFATDNDLFWSLSFGIEVATWEAIGGFCEEFTGYGGEDTDFGRTAARAGIGIVWVGGAVSYHQHHQVSDPPIEHLEDIVRNARLFFSRWGCWPMQGWLQQFRRRRLIEMDDTGHIVLTPQDAEKHLLS
jgi:GT2 family glycosyltransferase